jgi:hypothetical protein
MEIYVNGPGVTIAARDIGIESYKYWASRSEIELDTGSGTGKDLFDYSWNISDRNSMGVPDYADFLKDKNWSDINDPGNWVINACDYELADIWVEDDGVINKYRPDQIPHVKQEFRNFKAASFWSPLDSWDQNTPGPPLGHPHPVPKAVTKNLTEPDEFINHAHYYYYTSFSSEIGNWQHKQFNSSIPIMEIELQIIEIQKRLWIIGLETIRNKYTIKNVPATLAALARASIIHLDCHHRHPIRNRIFLEDWMKETHLRLDYDMFNCSNFKIHNKYFYGNF